MAKEQITTLEKGNIYFFYRPKVNKTEAENIRDVQNFYMVLHPENEDKFRLILMGTKNLPAAGKHEKDWGFVDRASSSENQIKEELASYTYETKTRGEQEQMPARPCGEGIYRLVEHGDHTHLVYALELPDQPGSVQQSLNIKEEANFIISVKNPDAPSPKGVGLRGKQKADFPKKLQEKFENRKFIALNPADFLNYEGAEILFIGVAEDVEEDLNIKLKPEDETEATAEIIRELEIDKNEHPVEPLIKGEWE